MTTQVELIRGKVARVLNAREVALNRGANDGVKVGMVFRILSAVDSEITDPDTGEVLGSVGKTKFRVRVNSVQERVSVAETFRLRRINVGRTRFARNRSSRLFESPRWVKRFETLKTKEVDLDDEDGYVSIGDTVVQEPEVSRTDQPNRDIDSKRI